MEIKKTQMNFSKTNKRNYIIIQACRDHETKTTEIFVKKIRKAIVIKDRKDLKELQRRIWQ